MTADRATRGALRRSLREGENVVRSAPQHVESLARKHASPPVRSKRRSASGTAVVVSATVLIAIAVLVISPGGTPPVLAGIGDTGVWVKSSASSAVGRVNTEIAELNVAVPLIEPRSELVQRGGQVIVVNPSSGTATRIDPATALPVGSVKLPRQADLLTIVGPDALVTSEGDEQGGGPGAGQIWSVPLAAFGDHDAEPTLLLDLGHGGVLAGTPDGGAIAVSPTTGELLRAKPGTSLAEAPRLAVSVADDPKPLQLVATSTAWAVLEPTGAALVTPTGRVDLSRFNTESAAGLALQSAADPQATEEARARQDPGAELDAPRASEIVLVASDTTLIEIDVATNSVSVLSTGHRGSPVRPVMTGGCAFAAWADGTSWQRCENDPPTGVAGVYDGLAASDRPIFRTNDGRAVLNDPESGRVWVPRSGNRLIDNWDELLHDDSGWVGAKPGAEVVPVVRGPIEGAGPLRQQSRKADSVPPEGASAAPVPSSPPGPPPVSTVPSASPPPPPEPEAAPITHLDPVATPVTASLFGRVGAASLRWAPFGGEADAVRGYFVQSLGAGSLAASTPCTVLPSGVVRPPEGGEVIDVGMWTSGLFQGIDEPGPSYGFVVWGYNSAGCAASDVVTLTPLAAPTAITAIEGAMVETGTDYDYQLTSATPAAARYEVQRQDASGGTVGAVAEFVLDGSSVFPRALTGGAFGEVYSFAIRACNAEAEGAACGAWTDAAAPEASLTFAPEGLSYSAKTGTWSWTSLPQNGSLVAKVRCGSSSNSDVVSTNSSTGCWTDTALDRGDAWLLVLVGSHSHRIR